MAEAVTFEKEMSINHRDFLRLLAHAVDGKNIRVNGLEIVVDEGNRRLDVLLSEESERKIALITLPVTWVRFTFSGYDDPEGEMARIDRTFQRGGG
jgi:hypothetical protein